jgi:hypothetical protein
MKTQNKTAKQTKKTIEEKEPIDRFPWGKFLLGYALYVFFHEINRLLPGTIIATIFGEGIESIYAHMKMLFYAYLILSMIDYFRYRKNGLAGSFVYARMLILSAVPWMMIILYYTVEAVGVVLPRSIDLPWALVVTAFGIYFAIRLEEPFEKMDLRPALKSAILVVFLAALITYVGFSFAIPDNFFIALE